MITTRVPEPTCGGTMMRAPFDNLAGLYDDDAVCPFTTGSASTISSVTRAGNSIEIGLLSNSATEQIIPSSSHFACSPTTSLGTEI